MLNYTTAQTQRAVKTQEAYDAWVSTLKCQDTVIVQLFQPKENCLLGSQFECWQFYKARLLKYESGGWEIDYNRKFVPIRKDGLLCYYGQEHLGVKYSLDVQFLTIMIFIKKVVIYASVMHLYLNLTGFVKQCL